MMRSFGLGITNVDLEKVQSGNASLIKMLKGKILLQVQAHGEAFYVKPTNGIAYYLKDGPAAYELMRFHSLGITTKDLETIPLGTLVLKPKTETAPPTEPATTPPDTSSIPLTTDPNTLISNAPSGFSLATHGTYWIQKMNELRAARGIRTLQHQNSLDLTSTSYANTLRDQGTFTHARPEGQTLTDWLAQWHLPLGDYGTAEGWHDSYFGENIGKGIVNGSSSSITQFLDLILTAMLAEEAVNGPHYRNIYDTDWNSIGTGFSFSKRPDGQYDVVFVTHYANLK
jgi:uncharacterized protein YkwD